MDGRGAGMSRSFTWLNVTQSLGALNDNVFKLLVIIFLVDGLGGDSRATIAMASAIFVVPFLLFSHAAGVLADRFSKRRIIVLAKCAEVAVMLGGCFAIYFRCSPALYALIFIMCTQSAVFGPSKYGIIPELVSSSQLSRANSLLVGLSYLAIILGTFIPSFFLDKVLIDNYVALAVCCVFIAVAGVFAGFRIERTAPAGSTRPFRPLFVVELYKTFRRVAGDRPLLLAILGSSFFLFLGAFIQQNLLVYGKDVLGLDFKQSGFLFPVGALGIGVGALLSGKVSGRNIEFGVVPLGAIGLTFCCLLFGAVSFGLVGVLVILFLVGVSSGLFIVPLNAFIQYRSPADRRGEILALSNFLSFLCVALSAGLFFVLSKTMSLTPRGGFLVVGLLTAVLACGAVRVLPDFLVRFAGVIVTRLFYRIRVTGLDQLPAHGPALLVPNHVTWVDALLISAVQQRRIRFVMDREIAEKRKWLAPLLRLMRVIRVSPTDPPRRIMASLKEARAALEDGYVVCVFAEGGMTRTGNLRPFRPGLERIVKGVDCPIVPMYIDGAWGSIFSYYHGRILSVFPRRIPYPVTLLFGAPLPASSTTAEVRQAVMGLSTEAFEIRKHAHRTLPDLFIGTARRRWTRPALWDTTGKRLSFGRTLTGAIALSRRIAKNVGHDERCVGIVMPACVGGALLNLALTLLGRVPVNLNFTASADAVRSAMDQCEIRTVFSSRAFMEKLEGFPLPEGTVYLEDVMPSIGPVQKLVALMLALFASPRWILPRARRPGPDDMATVIFSSGSTGMPKGVMLSHHNIISNMEAFLMVVRFNADDRMCAVLPFFHSFGFTCTLWCPLTSGFAVFYHPNPLDGVKVAEMVREQRLTALLATPTFLLSYMRRAKREDFETLRLAIVGAEKLTKRVADAFEERLGLRPLEGYGATELSPVAALSVLDADVAGFRQAGRKDGSVGQPLPGVSVKVVDPEGYGTLEEGREGLLLFKGPNVMQGYLGNPEKTAEVVRDGWYDTGDIGRIDEDGFIFLVDRLSRYSKIGGEMVPHVAVEDHIMHAIGLIDRSVVVTSAPDEKKGEQLVVFFTEAAGDAETLFRVIHDATMPNLWKPKKENLVIVDALPTLGSGKLDLKHVRDMAREFVERRPSRVQKAVDKLRDAL